MTSTALSLLPLAQGILGDASLSFEPDLNGLSTTSSLGLLGAFTPSLIDVVTEFAATLDQISGQILVTAGVLDTNLILADGSRFTGSFNAPATLNTLADLAALTKGTVTLAGGLLDGVIPAGDESLSLEKLDVAALVSTFVLDTINAISATVPFEKGAFSFTAGSALGPISGTVDVGGGDLNIDLDTPLGPLSADIDFGDEALFPFQTSVPLLGPINGVVDFNLGNIVASAGALGSVSIPISAVTGTLALANGIASLKAGLPVAGIPLLGSIMVPVSTEIEFGPLASQAAADLVKALNLAATIANGVLAARLDGPLGLLTTTFDIPTFTQQGANFWVGVDGIIDIGGGLLTAALTTPLGNFDSILNLADVAGLLDVPPLDAVLV